MVLSDLSLSGNLTSADFKAALEERLRAFLPEGSFTIILRNYQGDFRARSTSQARFNAMFLLDPDGKKAVLQNKDEIEALGFRVSSSGELSLN